VVSGLPVLADFDDSVLDRDAVLKSTASPIPRPRLSRFWKNVKESLLGNSPVAAGNIRRMLDLLKARSRQPRVLVIGGGAQGAGTEPLYNDAGVGVVGFDIYGSPLTQFIADAHSIPLASASVDAVVVQFVLEHVLDPWRVVAEIHRVLKDDGIVYAEVPFLQQVHEGPYDFTRFTQSGLRWLFRRFTLIESGIERGAGTQALWTIDHSVRSLFRCRRAGHAAKLLFFWVRFLDLVGARDFSADTASSFYLLGGRAEHEITPKEAMACYRGAQA
jgi:SAM-dependent methyltransferase